MIDDQRVTYIATALPPPRQSVTIPDFASVRLIAPIIVIKQREPLAPSGWPTYSASV